MNVLSVDFDIIMAPDIGLYNSMVGTSHDNSRSIDQRIKEHPILAGCRADLNHYQRLIPYILKVTQDLKIEDIRISMTHEDIKNVLKNMEDVHVFNIDHHHDLGYPQEGENRPKEEHCSCANWGEYYFHQGIITQFTWLNNTNSGPVAPAWENDSRITTQLYQETNLETLPKMDKLFLCLSPEWTPSMYHPLFYTILDLINEQKGCRLQIM